MFNEKGNKLTIRKTLINGELTMGENVIVRDGSRGMLKMESNLVASAVDNLRILVNSNIHEGLIELTFDLNGISAIDLNDETLLTYLEESREHLANLETNLLNIEENGSDIDEDFEAVGTLDDEIIKTIPVYMLVPLL